LCVGFAFVAGVALVCFFVVGFGTVMVLFIVGVFFLSCVVLGFRLASLWGVGAFPFLVTPFAVCFVLPSFVLSLTSDL